MEITDRKIILVLIIIQLLLCIPFINSFPVALDEPFSIFYAQQDINEIWEMLKNENNPPLHFLLLHYWIKLFGVSPFAVRFLSLIFSTLTIIPLFKLSKLLLGRSFAILVIFYFCFSTFNHYHAIEARTYSLLTLLFVSIILELYRILFNSKKGWIGLALLNGTLLYTHYLAFFIIGVEFLLFVIFFRLLDLQKVKNIVLSFIVSLILYIPGIVLFLQRFEHVSGQGTWVPKPHFTELYGNILRFFNGKYAFIAIALLVIGILIFNRKVVIKVVKQHFSKKEYWFALLAFALPYFGMYIVSVLFQPIFLDRYLLFITPFLYICLGILLKWTLTDFKYKTTFFIALFVVPMAITCYYVPKTTRESDKIAAHARNLTNESSLIVICPPFYDLTFLYHFDNDLFQDYRNKEKNMADRQLLTAYSYKDIEGKTGQDQVLFIDANSTFAYPENQIAAGFEKDYDLIGTTCFEGDYCILEYKKRKID